MTFKELMAEFGKKVGLAELVPNAEERCELDTPFATVNIQHVPETGTVLLYGMIRPLGPDPSQTFLRALLEANFMFQKTHGATLSIDAASNTVMLVRAEHLSALDSDRLAVILTRFLKAMGEWTKWEEPESESESASEPEAEEFFRV